MPTRAPTSSSAWRCAGRTSSSPASTGRTSATRSWRRTTRARSCSASSKTSMRARPASSTARVARRWRKRRSGCKASASARCRTTPASNPRCAAHPDLPKNIEGYYQETGRAGRDSGPADAWMTYGLADVVNQRRMIDESVASEDFKRIQRGKLDALLALAEAHDCRRVRLLGYFGEAYGATGTKLGVADRDQSLPEAASVRTRCGNCDNCLSPPQTWDATEAARKA